ncbi:unnamed protein product [Meganyctiphanes norvegica]|uniref:Cyclin-dependent kinase inhibitor domain-containing protein n=1 Tax=Meganyctiphanes norvegica TaxID=48144 RepID=A0AAV2SP36_MEGNR
MLDIYCNMISYPISVPRSPCNKPATQQDISVFFKRPLARRALTELGRNDPKLNMKMAESLLTISGAEFIKKWNFDPIREKPLPPGRYLWTAVKQQRRLARETAAAAAAASGTTEVIGLGAAPELDATVLSLPRASSPMMTAEVLDLDDYRSHNDRLSPIPRDVSPVRECHPRLHEEVVVDVVHDVALAAVASALHRTPKKSRENRESLHSPHSPKTKAKQCKITAFGRERKRVLSNSKSDAESDFELTPTKKPNTGKPKTPRKK